MAMVYDLPTVQQTPMQAPGFDAPQTKNIAAEQQIQAGQATTKIAAAVSDIMADVQHNVDTAAVKEMDGQLSDLIRKKQVEYGSLEGKNAIDAYADSQKAIKESAMELRKKASNDVQGYMFERAANERMSMYDAAITGHFVQQTKAYNKAETISRVDRLGQDIVANAGNPEFVKKYDAQIVAEIRDLGQSNGWGKETTDAAILKTRTGYNENIIDGLISNEKPEEAKQWYAENKGNIDPERYKYIDHSVNNAMALVDGKKYALDLFSKYGPKGPGDEIREDLMLKDVLNSGKPESVQTKAQAYIGDLVRIANAERARVGEDASTAVYDALNKDPNLTNYAQVKNLIDSNQGLTPKQRYHLNDAINDKYGKTKEINEQIEAEKQGITYDAMQDYLDGKAKYTPKDAITKLTPIVGFSNANEIARFIDKTSKANLDPKMTTTKFNGYLMEMMNNPTLADAIDSAGLNPTDKETAIKRITLQNYMLGLMADSAAEGKKISFEEAFDQALRKNTATKPGRIWGTNKVDFRNFDVGSADEDDKRAIAAWRLKSAGNNNPSEAQVQRAVTLLNRPARSRIDYTFQSEAE